jgi:hypothetical protein
MLQHAFSSALSSLSCTPSRTLPFTILHQVVLFAPASQLSVSPIVDVAVTIAVDESV